MSTAGRKTATARALRRKQTEAEARLWRHIRNRQLAGFKFVRQEPIGPYIADFCCRSERLLIELDGSQHADNPRDVVRDATLLRAGYRVLRFWNHEALGNMPAVLDTILAALSGADIHRDLGRAAPHPGPLPQGERE